MNTGSFETNWCYILVTESNYLEWNVSNNR